MSRCSLLSILLLAGCIDALYDEGSQLFPDSASATSTGWATTTTATSAAGDTGVQTVTSLPTSSGEPDVTTTASTSGQPDNLPPQIDSFVAQPSHLSEAGSTLLHLSASADVVQVRLSLGGAPLATLTPADFPYPFEILSAKSNFDHEFTVEVEDAEGLTSQATTKLTVQLPPSGAEKCLFEDKTAVSSVISALVYADDAIVALGARDTGAGYKLTLWKLDPDHCEEVLPGWPKTIADWTADPALAAAPSRGSALARDENGNLAIGGNLTIDGQPQRYVAFLNPDGARLWEKPGKTGEEVAGVAIAPNTVIAVGWQRTSENPVTTDAMIWRHLEGGSVWASALKTPFTADEAPDPMNFRSEWARAVIFEPATGTLYVAGEREFKDENKTVWTRTFVARFVPLGGPVGSPWTSPGDAYLHDAANALHVCGDTLIVGGWTKDEIPGALPQPLTRWFNEDGTPAKHLAELMPSTQVHGIACDRTGKVLSAAYRIQGQLDARVYAFEDPLGPRLWYETGSAGDDAAGALGCDLRGFCAWGGFRTVDAKARAVVRAHHP